ncbi:MAG: PqqD family protein [Microthrixaceae bacterium]
MSGRRYRVNAPHVINEVMDGEAVIINLATGDYFSLRGSGAFIWSALEQLADIDSIAAALTAAGMPAADATAGVDALVEQLASEGLIVVADEATPADAPALAAPPDPLDPPSLEKFTDMQDLILLDPVHEVDERGWPNAPSAS